MDKLTQRHSKWLSLYDDQRRLS